MDQKRSPVVGLGCAPFQSGPNQPLRIGQNEAYVRALIRAGAAPFLLPPLTDPSLLHHLYEQLDGVLLPGGMDVDPSRYGEPPHEKCDPSCREQDEAELTLARWAVADQVPLLAICRGIQVLNVALGGSLYQDIQAQVPGAKKHDRSPDQPRDHLSHRVTVAPGTRLHSILGVSSLPVNSMHHQALKNVAAGLIVAARALDGIIEAVEIGEHPFAVAVQWHPEELIDDSPHALRLFEAFVEECRKRARS